MNQGIYRLVFNKARGMIMVVGELARSVVKSGIKSLGFLSASRMVGCSAGPLLTLKPLHFAFLLINGFVFVNPVHAQIVTDNTAPANQQATVTTTANGTPQVNIQAPSAAGVSHNTYTQFDVTQQGVILNNATTTVQTQQAGLVAANQNLVNGSASIILNEVNSPNQSQLNGFVEVAGTRADVVIANPSGITCSGCGFINTQQATLTTGTPQISNGNLTGYQVQQGNITIGANGLDGSSTDFTQVISRSVQVNGALVANNLDVTTGTNQVDTQGNVTAELNSATVSPGLSVDVSALGGMYAGQIRLIGTEDGVGVRNAGEIGASAGNLTLTADGQLLNTGSMTATNNLTVTTQGDIDNSHILHSGANTTVDSRSTIANSGTISAYNNTTVNADGDITQTITAGMGAGIDAQGNVISAASHPGTANLTIHAGGDINVGGNQVASGDVHLQANNVTASQATQQGENIEIIADSNVSMDGVVQTSTALNIDANTIALTNSDQQANTATLTARGGDIDLTNSLLVNSQQLSLNATGVVTTNTAAVHSGDLTISASDLSNVNGELQQAGTTNINLDGAFDNTQGVIQGNQAINLQAAEFNNTQGNIEAGEDITLTASSALNNQSGTVVSDTSIAINTGAVNNDDGLIQANQSLSIDTNGQGLQNTASGSSGGLVAGQNMTLNAGTIDNSTGYIDAVGDLTITNNASVDNSQGDILSGQNLEISADNLDNQNGSLQAGNDITLALDTGTLNNQSALIRANGDVTVTANNINNTQTITNNQGIEGATVNLQAQTVDNTNGQLIADNLNIQVTDHLDNDSGLISATQVLSVTGESVSGENGGRVGELDNDNGTLIAGQTTNVTAGVLLGSGQILSEGTANIDLSGDYTHISDFLANDDLNFTLSGELNNQAALMASGDLNIIAASLVNALEGELSATNTQLTISGTLTNYGLINSAGTTGINADRLDNIGTGRIYGDNIAVQAVTFNNLDNGTVAAVIAGRNDVQLGVTTLTNQNGSLIYSDGDLDIGGGIANGIATGEAQLITNSSATIEAADNLSITAAQLDNLNPNIIVTTQTTTDNIVAYALTWNGTRYEDNGDTIRSAQTATDELWELYLNGYETDEYTRFDIVRITTEDVIADSDPGVITAGQNIQLDIGTLNNTDSQIAAGGTLEATVDNLNNVSSGGARTISETGTATDYWRNTIKNSEDDQGMAIFDYIGPDNYTRHFDIEYVENDPDIGPEPVQIYSHSTGEGRTETIELSPSIFQGNNSVNTGFTIAPTPEQLAIAEAQGTNAADIDPRDIASITEVAAANGVIRNSGLTGAVSNNSLFSQNPSPTSGYLIETDPQFTNNTQWLSSGYILSQFGISEMTQKRLGDGFYEQRLVREQMVELTGHRFLAGYNSDEEQYQALMDNGIAFAEEFDLMPGVRLSEAQMAALTTDIVWLETETVTLRDGSTHDVLVPKVYALVQDGDLNGSGALLSGRSVNLQSDQLVNSGAIAARERVDLSGTRITDRSGRVQADTINANVTEDINLEGSQWRARDGMSLRAGRDISLTTQTQTTSTDNGSRSTTGQQASLFVTGPSRAGGNASSALTLSADRNLTVTGGQVVNQGAGDTTLQAGEALTLNTVTEGETHRTAKGQASQQTVTGTQITGQGNVSLTAGTTLSAEAATINAGNNLSLDADTITLTAGQNTDSLKHKSRDGRYETRNVTHTLSQLNAGNNVTINADNDLTLEGTNVSAGNDLALNAGGDTRISAVQDEQYSYSESKNDGSFGRSKTKIKERFQTTTVGGELIAGTNEGEDGNLTINSQINGNGSISTHDSGSVSLQGATLTADENVVVSGDGVSVTALKDINYERSETLKKGFGGLSSSRKGSMTREQLLQSSEITALAQDLSLLSDSDIVIMGSDVISGGDINLLAVDDIIVSADQVISESKNWSQQSRFNPISTSTIYEREDHIAGDGNSTAQASTLNAGGNLNMDASRIKIIGSDLSAEDNINATTDVGDIEILSAHEAINRYSKDTTVNVTMEDVVEQMVDEVEYMLDVKSRIDEIGTDDEKNQATMTISKAEYDQVDSKTQITENRASSLSANGNINLNAAGDIAVQGSDLIADADQNQDGDLTLQAGGDVEITESSSSSDTQTKETHGKGELSAVVQHQAVEIVQAAKAVDEAKDQLKDAKEDYRQYKKDLKQLKRERDQLQADYENKVPGITYEDIVELNDLIDDTESDEEWYKAGIVLAAANLASKITLLVQQTVAGAASVGTWGFNAGVQLDLEASKTDHQSHSESSRGSLLSGNNIVIRTGSTDGVEGTQTLIRGSHLNASNTIDIQTGDLNIEASRDNHNSTTDTDSAHIRIAQTLYGAAGGPTISVDYTRSRAKDGSTTFNNSTLTANNINLSSENDTIIKGANIDARDTLNLDVGNNLHVQSMQDRYNAKNNSLSISASASLGTSSDTTNAQQKNSHHVQSAGKNNGQVSSVGGGLSASNGRTRVKETVLTSLTGNTVNINVGDRASIVGATIASTDENGNDNGQLTLNTQHLDFADLSNTAYSSNQSAGFNTNVGLGNQSQSDTNDPSKNTGTKLNTTQVSYSNTRSYDKTKSLATLGTGNVTVRSDAETGEDSTERLNRDLDNTNKAIYSTTRQSGNIDLTVDTRLLTEDGREEIAAEVDKLVDEVKTSPIYRETQVAFSQMANNLDAEGEQTASIAFANPEQALDQVIAQGIRTGDYSSEEAMAVLTSPEAMLIVGVLQTAVENPEFLVSMTGDHTVSSPSNEYQLGDGNTVTVTDSEQVPTSILFLQGVNEAQVAVNTMAQELGIDPANVIKVLSYTTLMATGRGGQIVMNEVSEQLTGDVFDAATQASGTYIAASAHQTSVETFNAITSDEFVDNAPEGQEPVYQALSDDLAASQAGAQFLSTILLGTAPVRTGNDRVNGNGETGSSNSVNGPEGSPATPKVTAEAEVDGVKFNDTNQGSRPPEAANPNTPTLIADDIQIKIDKNPDKNYPNANMATAHAEIGAIQQAFDAGKTQGKNMTMKVEGMEVCGYCRSDIRKAADKSGLNSLTIYEAKSGKTLVWTRREDGSMGKMQEIKPKGDE